MRSRTKTIRGTSEDTINLKLAAPALSTSSDAIGTVSASEQRPGARTGSSSNPLALPKYIRGPGLVPPQWRSILSEVLITEPQLRRRVAELARAITREYVGKDLFVVAVLTGTVMFLADLLRHLRLPLRLDFVGVSSYRDGAEPGRLIYTKSLRLQIKGRDVLLVDDILDTGRTLSAVQDRLWRLRPRSLRTCVLLDKPSGRTQQVTADFVGFVVPDVFVVGYGLDYAECYRNLPFVGVLRPDLL